MRRIDQMRPSLFAVYHVVMGVFSYRCFMAVAFSNYLSPVTGERVTLEWAHGVLIVLVLGFTLGGCVLAFPHYRCFQSVIINVLSPYGAFLLLRSYPDPISIVIFGGFGICVCVFALREIFWAAIRHRRGSPLSCKTVLKRIFSILRCGQLILAAGLCGVMLIFCMGYGITLPPAVELYEEHSHWSGDRPPEEYAEELTILGAQWEDSPAERRLEALTRVAEIETAHLGLCRTPKVEAELMQPWNLGCYQDTQKTILINEIQLTEGTASDCVRIILHECCHAYQHELCRLYQRTEPEQQTLLGLRKAGTYLREFAGYRDGVEDFDAYQSQTCESDAREYAEQRLIEYACIM